MDEFAAYRSVFTYFKKKYHFHRVCWFSAAAAAGGGPYIFRVPAWVCFGSPAFQNNVSQVIMQL